MSLKTYDPKNVLVIVGGNPIQGFADGTFIMIAQDEDSYSKVTGADGETSRARSNNRSCSVTITLKQTSSSNDVLEQFVRLDDIGNGGVVPIQVKDLLGTTLFNAPEAWIRRRPDSEFSKEVGDRQWVLDTAAAAFQVGGN